MHTTGTNRISRLLKSPLPVVFIRRSLVVEPAATMKTTRRPNVFLTLLWALCALTLFAFLQPAESRAVSNDGPSSVSHLVARADEAPSLYLDDTGEWNSTSAEDDLVVRRGYIEKRTLQYTKNGKKFVYSEVDYPTTQQMKDELFVGEKKAILDGGVNIQYFYTVRLSSPGLPTQWPNGTLVRTDHERFVPPSTGTWGSRIHWTDQKLFQV